MSKSLMSPQIAKFVEAKLKGLNNREAAVYAGYAPASAKQRGYELMKRSEVREALGITLEHLGITFEKAVKPVAEALEATKSVAHKRWVKGENGDLYEEMYVETEPDHSIRLSAHKAAMQLLKDEYTSITQKPDVAKYGPPLTDEQIQALQSMDEVELQRVVFRKSDDENTGK